MKRDHRRARSSMMPFCVDRGSVGRPYICHMRSFTGSTNVWTKSQPAVCGTPRSTNAPCHPSLTAARNSDVKGPR